MFVEYPKMKTLFKLLPSVLGGKKWSVTSGEILPETAPLHYLPLSSLVFTEKIDGTNMAIRVNDKIVQKRNMDCKEDNKDDRFYIDIRNQILFKIAIAELTDCIIYGELVGPKIQKGGNYFNERKFLIFDIYNIKTNKFFTWDAVLYFADLCQLQTVPEIEYLKENLSIENIKEAVENLMSVFNPSYPAEGFVIRYRKDTSFDKRWMAKIRRQDF